MPKIVVPLSEKTLKALKPQEKAYKKFDGNSMYVLVSPTGTKSFVYQYKSPLTNKYRRIVLGVYPTTTLAQAREKRAKIAADVINGIDPLIKNPQENKKLSKIANDWLDIKLKSTTQSYNDKERLVLNRHILSQIGDLDINTISTMQIIDTLKNIEKQGKLETTKRMFSLLNQIYRYAVSNQLVKHNIIADIDYRYTFAKTQAKHYASITDPKRLMILKQSIDEYSGDVRTKYALKLAMLTALRPFNIRSLSWDEVDFKNELLKIPANKMKMKREFILPLSRQAIEILKEYRQIVGTNQSYLFGSLLYKNRAMSENTLNTALRRMGYAKDEMVSHGFRASFSTIAHEYRSEHKLSSDIIELCLAHEDKNNIRAAYNRALNLNDMRLLMQWWADFLDLARVNEC